jgi:hypothetical protein
MSAIATRFAARADQPALIAFIRDHWSATHVFVQAPEVFDWQYGQADGRLNMVLAEQDGIILGVLGFIPLGRHDAALGDGDVLLALWKVREDGVPPGVGLRLLKFIQSQLQPRIIGAIGISDMVGPIYKALGYSLGKLAHAALFNPGVEARIAQGVPRTVEGSDDAGGYSLGAVTEADVQALAAVGVPRKSWAYVQDRYLNHPYYDYTLRTVRDGGQAVAVVVWRAVVCDGTTLLRIVDVIGGTAWLAHGRGLLLPEVVAAGAEYIDLMQYGTDDLVLQAGGWVGPDWVEGLVLPNYFAPFVAANVTIKLAFKQFSGTGPVHLYRADSDQDRPNQMPLPRRMQS